MYLDFSKLLVYNVYKFYICSTYTVTTILKTIKKCSYQIRFGGKKRIIKLKESISIFDNISVLIQKIFKKNSCFITVEFIFFRLSYILSFI